MDWERVAKLIVAALKAFLPGFLSEQLGRLLEDTARETQPFGVQTIVTNAQLAIQHPTSGLVAAHTEREQILADIAALTPVTLPTTPPAGYGAPTPDEIADLLTATPWLGTYTQQQSLRLNWQYATSHALLAACGQGIADWRNPDFALVDYGVDFLAADLDLLQDGTALVPPVATDWTAWDGVETLADLLTRLHPAWTWTAVTRTGEATPDWVTGWRSGMSSARWRCLVPQSMLPVRSGQLGTILAGSRRSHPPIWPGLANVTLGDPVALSPSLTLAGPMDGVIVDITTPPTGLGKFVIGDRTAYYSLGQVAFTTDTGAVEGWQYLTWDVSLYGPRQMARAESALVRCLAGAQGWATPWLMT